jgi:hypothetical protein
LLLLVQGPHPHAHTATKGRMASASY